MGTKFMRSSTGEKFIVNSSNLNDETGQIEYIFTDKTGTLTQNNLILKELIFDAVSY